MNRKIASIFGLLVIITTILASGCTQKTETKEEVIHAYVGAGMQKPMDEIGKMFEKKYGIKLEYDYAGSGYLYSKILASNEGDIFMPGAYFYIGKLEKKGYILKYENFTKHIPVIVVQKGNPKNITCLEDLEKPGVKLALGDDDIAIGRTVKKILQKAENYNPGISEKINKNVVVRGATVKQVLMYVIEGDVDAAIVWRADAVENKDKVDIIPIDPKYNVIKTVPIAILKTTKNKENAEKFYNFVLTDGKNIFKKYGFEIIGN
ncbi:molybdenum ABC transporter, periplasmic molybdate-binding protein [Methanocaldococcus vulcanius M7]|uniref:Molybdenum ABC transporter, periplasmic molybdate-binding protein n=1 Tax=Methanocaldococcus vulcanius (strain ATCC 700851 / DSM 12094 / M7) TaxID=579137 RepID=C9RH85_METVM|nr:molybdate ABC transporter substrate-binding protein [Methanocaldococcus vulcanius]ACX72937.1 molybdenum ABC transporter, periplasmic molybdate-binding protein [Methanocaldococcus vulcanius M7]